MHYSSYNFQQCTYVRKHFKEFASRKKNEETREFGTHGTTYTLKKRCLGMQKYKEISLKKGNEPVLTQSQTEAKSIII